MPTYDYRCKDCDFEFEEFQSIVSEPLTICPQCGGRILRLISGGAGLIFKGSGFYETDYKRKKPAESKTEKASTTPAKAVSESKE
jgi:putative FmdB family regulatory protein